MEKRSGKEVLQPIIDESVFVAPGARIYGDVIIQRGASIWFNAVLRGDEGRIEIGADTNVQDNVTIHSDMGAPVIVGERVTIGHNAVVRSCEVGSDVMIGMNATIMSHARIGEQSVVGANSFVPYNKAFPPRSMIIGSPARVVRQLTDEEIRFNQAAVDIYKELVRRYRLGEIAGVEGAGAFPK